jgi:Glyoxalase-like domain
MPGPARAGAVVYAKNVELLSGFYEKLLPMTRLHATDELVVLESPDFQLVVHALPPHIAPTVSIQSPPERRDRVAVKLFFTVASIATTRYKATELGGEVLPEQWQGPGFNVCNACDPEGNLFQVRETV